MPGLGQPERAATRWPAPNDHQRRPRGRGRAGMDMDSDLREVYDTANRNNVAIYAVDPRGLRGFEFDINEGIGLQTDSKYLNSTMDTLRMLAENTDGRAIVNRNDLAAGMKQITRDSSAYYLLGYNSSQAPSDGKFHEIKVRVKRPGVQVRARKGYWALTQEQTARALAPPKAARRRRSKWRSAAVNRPGRAPAWSAPGSAPRAARTARRGSRSCGSRCRSTGDRPREKPARVADGDRAGRPPSSVSPAVARRWLAAASSAAPVPLARHVRRQPGKDPAADVGRRRRLAGARQRDARDRDSRSDVGADHARHAGSPARAHGARIPAAEVRRRPAFRSPRASSAGPIA